MNFWLSIALAVVFFVVGVYDAIAVFLWGPELTVTALIRSASQQWPTLAFVAGFVAGHLFG